MALMWRLSTRRAGRRTLAAAGGAACLWLLAVLLLPAVLPPSNAPHEAQPPAQRRIHQQQVDAADYTGGKTGRRAPPGGGKEASQQLQEGSIRGISPGLVNVGADHQSRNLINPANEDRSFPLTERGSGSGADTARKGASYSTNEVVQLPDVSPVRAVPDANARSKSGSDDTVSLMIATAGVNVRNKNVVFAPINSAPIISESQDNPFLGDDPDIAVVPPQEGGERLEQPDRKSAPLAKFSAASNQGETVADSANNAAEEVVVKQEVRAPQAGPSGGREATADISEGPYTLPILKAPKDSVPAPPKRGGYLSRLNGVEHRPALPSEAGEDVGEGSAQPVVPFMVAKGAFRGVGGVFPIHPVEFMHPGGMMGDVMKDHKQAANAQEKAQIMAMTAMEHGHKITQHQQDMINKLSPGKRKQLEIRTREMRLKQEKAYISQLRARHQIVEGEGGGEKVVSAARMTIRFPPSLKKLQPEDWPQEYKVYLNITHSPWIDAHCNSLVTRFTRPHSLPTRAIASFPSSGNTWIRYLIEGATGIYTGSMYDDSSLTRKGMYGEAVPYDGGLTLLQKTHGYTVGDAMKEDHKSQLEHNHFREVGCRGVVVVRNPFKALISHRHLDIGGHTGYAPKSQFQGEGWDEFVSLKIKLWEQFYKDWLEQCPSEDVFITHFELLKSDLKNELTKIVKFLRVPLDEQRLSCVESHSDGLFKRKPSKNVPHNIDYYPRHLKDKIYLAIDRLNDVLRSKGKENLPFDNYEMYDANEAKISRQQRNTIENTIVP